ncbi:MAG: class I SAM-dependent methyltransferase [Candidatus Omnitrophica bacterium]|nr:class I SAM-dependent methyltransferase [Candidatus Omnitrophota bacterium]MBU1929864.1 class I SAM-dependent methyltransferase [Candidatus Omnitrophota bacterium]MBU2034659.1 class I SAM-dependent methyltransferase [Candidatus Omnitrophota bacterium]
MNKKTIVLFFFMLFSPIVISNIYSFSLFDSLLDPEVAKDIPNYSPERELLLPQETVINELNITPNMNILDLGAGKGYLTFPLAKALKNTGKVFAADINPEELKYINKKNEKAKYKNIVTALVDKNATDSFFKNHSFDIILVCEVLPYIDYPEVYFQALRRTLAKETGRLYIIDFKNVTDFSIIDFADFKTIINELKNIGYDHPVFLRMDKQVQEFIKNGSAVSIPMEIKIAILRDFNNILSDRYLFKDFKAHIIKKNPAGYETWPSLFIKKIEDKDFGLFRWLFIKLDAKGIFYNNENLSNDDTGELKTFNKLLLVSLFNLSGRTAFIRGEYGSVINLDADSIIHKLQTAGYTFVKEHDILSQYYILEFKRSN